MMGYRYYIATSEDGPWMEVDKAEYVASEHISGFRNTLGQPEEPATHGFTALDGVRGKVEWERES